MSVTKITEKLTINAPKKDVVLDGFDFTANGYVEVVAAKSVTIRNCRVYALDVSSASKNYWFYVNATDPVKVRIENCFFGDNPSSGSKKVYNLIEPHCTLSDGSGVCENYFADSCCTHNAVNIYGATENSSISVDDNVFEVSAGTIRIGTIGTPTCAIDISRNTVLAEHPSYGAEDQGLVTIQPYGKQTPSFNNMTVTMDDNALPTEQIVYGWYGSSDTTLTQDIMPAIFVNGAEIEAPIYH